MARLRTEELRAGMVIAKPLYTQDGAALVKARSILTDRIIRHIERWNIPVVEVEGITVH